nr:glycine-rich protein A3-like [Ipomoea batatas]
MGGGKDKHDESDKGLFSHLGHHAHQGYPPQGYPPQGSWISSSGISTFWISSSTRVSPTSLPPCWLPWPTSPICITPFRAWTWYGGNASWRCCGCSSCLWCSSH